MKKILVTGAAGFIGANLVKRLLGDLKGATIVGIDNMNDYYDVALKEYRLKEIEECNKKSALSTFVFVKGSIADKALLEKLFAEYRFDVVVNLAAQAGVRYSIDNPDAYIESNIIGFYNILDWRRADIGPWSIWYMLHHRVCMEAIRKYHSLLMTRSTILFRSMLPPKRVMN